MKYRLFAVMLVLCLFFSVSYAEINEIQADLYFHSLIPTLYTDKTMHVVVRMEYIASSIQVTRCRLYKKIGSSWNYVEDLACPSTVETNSDEYDGDIDYSNDIGTGTYKILVTVTADTHTKSVYSNVQTF